MIYRSATAISSCYYLLTILINSAVAQNTRQQLAFPILSPSPDIIKNNAIVIQSAVKKQVGQLLKIPEDSIELSPLKYNANNELYYHFSIDSDNLKVFNSVRTPKAYETYKEKWITALKSIQIPVVINVPETSETIHLIPNTSVYEYPLEDTTIQEGELSDVEKIPIPNLNPTIKENIKAHKEFLQIRLKQTRLSQMKLSYQEFDMIIAGIRSIVSQVLGVPEDHVILYSLASDTVASIVIQFTVYPATKEALKEYSNKWKSEIANQNSKITQVFKDVDFAYPASSSINFGESKETETENNDANSENRSTPAGLVVGSVCGAVLVIGVIGGAGYYFKKKRDAKKAELNQNDFEDQSPGEISSPSELQHNVDIQADDTSERPHDHRYHHH